MPRRLPIIATAVGLCAAALLAARPLRWEVEGLSMAPGLVSGDIVESGSFPRADRLRNRRRFDRWIVRAPDGSTTIKRLVGLPGERLSIESGDLSIDGNPVLAPPPVLAQMASPVTARPQARPDGSIELEIEGPVLDDAAFAPQERRLLLPVRDVGVSAIVAVNGGATGGVTLVVGSRAARFTLRGPARRAVVAGRLDGCFVAAAWPVAAASDSAHASAACLPPGAPPDWAVSSRWPGRGDVHDEIPRLECRIAPGSTQAVITVVSISAWRDVLHRPAADGASEWRLGPHEVFVLGDFPSGSRDSRHWGPIGAEQLLHRVARSSRDAGP
jgi:type IV secretory pathway protease TraF